MDYWHGLDTGLYITLFSVTCPGSLTSDRCVSPVPFNVVSEPLLMYKLAASLHHHQPAHLVQIFAM